MLPGVGSSSLGKLKPMALLPEQSCVRTLKPPGIRKKWGEHGADGNLGWNSLRGNCWGISFLKEHKKVLLNISHYEFSQIGNKVTLYKLSPSPPLILLHLPSFNPPPPPPFLHLLLPCFTPSSSPPSPSPSPLLPPFTPPSPLPHPLLRSFTPLPLCSPSPPPFFFQFCQRL